MWLSFISIKPWQWTPNGTHTKYDPSRDLISHGLMSISIAYSHVLQHRNQIFAREECPRIINTTLRLIHMQKRGPRRNAKGGLGPFSSHGTINRFLFSLPSPALLHSLHCCLWIGKYLELNKRKSVSSREDVIERGVPCFMDHHHSTITYY